MTATTEPWYFRALADDLLDTVRKGYELDPSNIVSSLRSAADQIDQLAAARDDARRELAEQKRINASNLRVMTGKLGQARKMLADAPHGRDSDGARCPSEYDLRPTSECRCWKAGM
jgi:hypothetical protein